MEVLSVKFLSGISLLVQIASKNGLVLSLETAICGVFNTGRADHI